MQSNSDYVPLDPGLHTIYLSATKKVVHQYTRHTGVDPRSSFNVSDSGVQHCKVQEYACLDKVGGGQSLVPTYQQVVGFSKFIDTKITFPEVKKRYLNQKQKSGCLKSQTCSQNIPLNHCSVNDLVDVGSRYAIGFYDEGVPFSSCEDQIITPCDLLETPYGCYSRI